MLRILDPVEALYAFAALCIFITMAYAIVGAVRAKKIEASASANRSHLVLIQKQLDAIETVANSNLASSMEIIRSLEIVRKQKIQDLADVVTMAVGHKQGVEEERANPTTFASGSPAAAPAAPAPARGENGDPIPVTDKETTKEARRTAEATESMARSAERSADSAEKSAGIAQRSADSAEKSAAIAEESVKQPERKLTS